MATMMLYDTTRDDIFTVPSGVYQFFFRNEKSRFVDVSHVEFDDGKTKLLYINFFGTGDCYHIRQGEVIEDNFKLYGPYLPLELDDIPCQP